MMQWPGGHLNIHTVQSTFSKEMDDFTRFPEALENLKEAIQMLKTDKIQMAGIILLSQILYLKVHITVRKSRMLNTSYLLQCTLSILQRLNIMDSCFILRISEY